MASTSNKDKLKEAYEKCSKALEKLELFMYFLNEEDKKELERCFVEVIVPYCPSFKEYIFLLPKSILPNLDKFLPIILKNNELLDLLKSMDIVIHKNIILNRNTIQIPFSNINNYEVVTDLGILLEKTIKNTVRIYSENYLKITSKPSSVNTSTIDATVVRNLFSQKEICSILIDLEIFPCFQEVSIDYEERGKLWINNIYVKYAQPSIGNRYHIHINDKSMKDYFCTHVQEILKSLDRPFAPEDIVIVWEKRQDKVSLSYVPNVGSILNVKVGEVELNKLKGNIAQLISRIKESYNGITKIIIKQVRQNIEVGINRRIQIKYLLYNIYDNGNSVHKGLILHRNHYIQIMQTLEKVKNTLYNSKDYDISIIVPSELKEINNFYLIPLVRRENRNHSISKSLFNYIKKRSQGILLHYIDIKQLDPNYSPWNYVEVKEKEKYAGQVIFYFPPFIIIDLNKI